MWRQHQLRPGSSLTNKLQLSLEENVLLLDLSSNLRGALEHLKRMSKLFQMYHLWMRTSKELTVNSKHSGKGSDNHGKDFKQVFHSSYPANRPDFATWCKQMNVGCLSNRNTHELSITMGTKVKLVDLPAILENRDLIV